ncbi:MAG: D-alanine--D-alanine ligase A [Coxiella sp. RIFCSPHIGHO2_12_FULL_44_14]|nr:MAG: D-alanine--D-alanine ligase A [Coxiella sp. RIFCSPHIGHO2_12_FULL_44_14]
MSEKLRLTILCGGQSTEHAVSISSAKNIVKALNPNKYIISVIYITHEGQWFLLDSTDHFIREEPSVLLAAGKGEPITVLLGENKALWQSRRDADRHYPVDCVFPMIHGTMGEDGALQGLLEFLSVPYVGADVQSSALCIEKDVTKRLLRQAGIPTPDWHTIYPNDAWDTLFPELSVRFGKTLFVKPASLGSSVCTVPVSNTAEFNAAVARAFMHDERVLIEPRIYGREVECAVLGNAHPKASLPGEIIVHRDYYSYEAKYLDPQGATLQVPAILPEDVTHTIQQIAIRAFKTLHCWGMARVDFFIEQNKTVLVNELNTVPGFTDISMYPMMWEASGLSYRDLLDQLIELAIERSQYRRALKKIYIHETKLS